MSRLAVAITHVEFGESEQTLYVITVHQDADSWDVRRAFSDFRRLRDDVQRVLKDDKHLLVQDAPSRTFASAFQQLSLPPKRLFGSKKDRVVRERAKELHRFLLKLLLLTHTYRKQQKALCEQLHAASGASARSIETRGEGSESVFHLLRDFLKPSRTLGPNGEAEPDGEGDGDARSRRMSRAIRETRLLNMQPSSQTPGNSPAARPSSLKSFFHLDMPAREREPSHPHPSSEPSTSRRPQHAPMRTASSRMPSSAGSASPVGPSRQTTTGVSRSHGSALLADIEGTHAADVRTRERAAVSMSLPTTESSSSNTGTPASPVLSPPLNIRRSTRHHRHHSAKMSQAEKEFRQSERLSRLTPQLTAQMITIEAQHELEGFVSEFDAIMILRYVDRFISKAVTRAPGCYTIVGNRLVVDGERFAEELEGVFADLPRTFEDALKNAAGEWRFPKALDAYVQMKWNSFQGKKKTTSRVAGSDSESESEYEYEQETGGFMKLKQQLFSQDETDALQKMIDQGRAGNDQMLRLRRQCDERGWYRHMKPGDHTNRVSDTDEDDGGSGSEASIRRFQEQENAKRKDRLSRRPDFDDE